MTAQHLTDLAARVEAASGADRELDELIAAELAGAVREYRPELGRAAYYHKSGSPWMYVHVPEPGYTASLDAAMTLVSDQREWNVEGWPKPSLVHKGRLATAWVQGSARVYAATPALALTAAALRARAAMMEQGK